MSARRAYLIGAALLVAIPCASAHAQAAPRPPDSTPRLPAVWIGTGPVAGHNHSSNATLATNSGGLLSAAIELPRRATLGGAQLALRMEGGWSQQDLSSDKSSGLSGNVQTVGAGIAIRLFPGRASTMLLTNATARRFSPYLVAGVGVTRPSTRVLVSINNVDMPSAQFGQTSSEVGPTAAGGLGAQVRLGRARLFAEARTGYSRLGAGTLRGSVGTIGLVFQPHH